MKKKIILLLTCITFIMATAFSLVHAADQQGKSTTKLQQLLSQKPDSRVYFVLMAQDPVIKYKGDVSGFSATKPQKGMRLNADSTPIRQYRKFLKDAHDNVMKRAGIRADKKIHDYGYALNGFAAKLSQDEVKSLVKQPGIVAVKPDVLRYKTTENSAEFLGLTDRGGAWRRGLKGEDVVIGVIDSGIWPEHPSFADDGSYSELTDIAEDIPCEFGNVAHNPGDVPFECNEKLIGARQMLDTYRAIVGANPGEFDSARDDDGHGTHTASTAGGNEGVEADIFGLPRGLVAGIAPRARIIAYKGLGELGGFGSDLAAAIDQAVADGVDVINYSVGGGASLTGADDLAFLFAADAGVFVATSAGNSGPDPETMGGPATVPWITSVGASTQNRGFISDITLDGPGYPPEDIWGGSVTEGITNANLVDAEGIADTTGDTSGMCLNPFPDGTFTEGDAVLCNQYDFGVARTDRVNNVKNAGGSAVIFHNSPAVSMMPTDNHPLPTVHMLNGVGDYLKAYLVANPGAVTVSFTQGEAVYSEDDERVVPNVMASFSSRGGNPVAADIIKPDVTAPGVNILAGASPMHVGTGAQGQLFQSIMGTSMSSPEVAGILALLKQAHPDWSPAMAKSALMTTSYQEVLKEDGVTPADPFDMGAGHVNPGGRANKGSLYQPGLAYDAGFTDYLGFLCDADPGVFADPDATCSGLQDAGIPVKAFNLNLPSIGVAQLSGSRTITRTVTSVAKERGWRLYFADVDAPPGFDVAVSPCVFWLKKGQTFTYDVTFTNVDAPIGEWRFGSLTWRGWWGRYNVYSPIALRASLFDAPAELSVSGETGSDVFEVNFGYSGSYAANAHGLEAAVVTSDNVLQDPDQNFDPSDGFSNVHTFNLSGAAYFRIAMPPEATEPEADLDLYVFNPDGSLVAASTSGGTDEQIDILEPMDGTWSVWVHGWQAPGGDSDYDMYSWIISATPGGNLTVDAAPESATIGDTESIEFSWTGATSGSWHLGAVSHTGDEGLMGLTLIEADNR